MVYVLWHYCKVDERILKTIVADQVIHIEDQLAKSWDKYDAVVNRIHEIVTHKNEPGDFLVFEDDIQRYTLTICSCYIGIMPEDTLISCSSRELADPFAPSLYPLPEPSLN